MMPFYYIYQQILAASGRPLPESAINREDLAMLLQSGDGSGVNGNPTVFFQRLRAMLLQSGTGMSSGLRTELDNFLLGYRSSNRSLARAFLELPAADYCEGCYNMLIGYALDGYDNYIGRLLQLSDGKHIRDWNRQQQSNMLVQLAGFPIDWEATHSGIMVCLRVKAALCVLLHRLYVRRDVVNDNCRPPFDVAELLKQELLKGPPDTTRDDAIMQLYHSATGKTKTAPGVVAPAAPVVPAPEPLPVAVPAPASVHGDRGSMPLIEMAEGMKEDFREMLMAVGMRVQHVQPAREQGDLSKMRRIGSKEAMQLLGIGSKKLQRLRDSGKLPYLKVTRTCTYLLSDVLRLLSPAQRKGGNTPETP